MTTTSNLRRFGPYPYASDGIPTAEASRAEGYERGLTWTAPWQPGGPFFGDGPTDTDDADLNAFRKAQRENSRSWLEGFAAGRADAAART
jgi:hypothetical protein